MGFRLDELTLHNFGIFKDEVIPLEGIEVLGILAEYANDPKRSNRSGKTLIMESIRYLLTGLNRATKTAEMIHEGEDAMWVIGKFSDENGRVYTIKRGVDHKGTGTLNVDWTEKTADGTKAIENLFGVTKDDFDLTSFFKQADINGFMDLGPAKQTEFLMKWLDNEHWKAKLKMVLDDIKMLTEKLRENNALKKALETSMEIDDDLRVTLEALNEANKTLTAKKAKLKENRDKLTRKIDEINRERKGAIRNCVEIKREITQTDLEVEKLAGLKKKRTKLLFEKDDLASKIQPTKEADYSKLVEEIAKIKADMATNANELKSLENAKGICPILKSPCDSIKVSAEAKKNNLKEQTALTKKLNALLADKDKHRWNNEVSESINEIKGNMSRVDAKIEASNLKDNRGELKAELEEETKKTLTFATKYVEKQEAVEDQVDEIEATIQSNNQSIGALESRITKAEEALSKINKVTERSEKLTSRLADLKYIAGMFGRNGIPADEIENAFQEVQDDINYILKELDCGLTVSFSPDKELNTKEPVCHCGFKYPKGYRGSTCEECNSPRLKQRKDEISLKILENGVEKNFKMDSGGGKTIVSYAVRIALSMLKRRQNKCKLDMLFLDEVDSALDSHLATGITDSITKVLTKKLGYDQIFMVSHKEEIKNAVPHILKVTRHEKHSTTELF